jgi:taurine dioxygenase
MMFEVQKLAGPFGVEITNVDLPGLPDAGLAQLLQVLYANRFVVIRTGGLTASEYVGFARRVGDPILFDRESDHPEIIPITNVDVDTKKEALGAAHWHTDQSFTKARSSITMLYSVQAPQAGGETRFCDMAAAYAALPSTMQDRIEDLVVEHRHGVSVAARPGDHKPIPPKGWDRSRSVYHPIVRRHPMTGEKTLYAITGTSQGIRGMPDEEATALLNELCEHALQPQFMTAHQHRVDDLVMWDNPTTMHAASPIAAATGPGDTRVIRRISLRGTPSVFAERA